MIAEHQERFSSSTASLGALWRHTSDLIFEYNLELKLVSLNPAAQEFATRALDCQGLMGCGNGELFDPAVGSEMDAHLKDVLSSKKSKLVEFKTKTLNGEMVFESLIVFADEETKETSRLIVIHRDITLKRKRFTALAEELEQQKAFLLNVINTSPNPIFVKNLSGQYTLANEACAEIWNMDLRNMLGKTDDELAGENSLSFRRQDLAALENGTGISFEEEILAADGSRRWFQTMKRVLRDPKTQEQLILGTAVNVTKIKSAEEAIRKSESLFRNILSNAPIIVAAIDNNGIITLSEGRALSHLRLKPGENVGKSVFDIYAKHPHIVETIRTVLEKKIEFTGIFEFNGRVLESTFTPMEIGNAGNTSEGLVVVAYDITERHEAESALRFTQYSIDRSGEAAFWINSSGRFVYVNDKACQLSGYSREELLKKNVADISPEEMARRWETSWKQIRRQKSNISESEIIRKDGRSIPIEISQNYIRFDDKEFNCTFVKDITDRKRSETALLESERRFRNMADSSPAFVCMFDIDTSCSYANRTLLEFLNAPLKDVLGRGYLNFVHSEDLEFYPEVFAKSAKAKVAIEGRIRRADGSFRWVLSHIIPRLDERSKLQGYLLSGVDITERREAVQALQKAAKELERSNRELEQFAYVASHDLQEPLRMISGFCELLNEQYHGRFDSQADEYLSFIMDGSRRMTDLIRDLLLYSRCSRQSSPLELVDCESVLKLVKGNLQLIIEESKAEIRNGPLPKIRANRMQLVQLFQNLIDNALKYRSSDRLPEVDIRAKRKNGEWIFSLRDNGKGFEMKHSERIFQIFQRLEKRGAIGGSGIGLSIAKKIVENAGGRIWVHSEKGVGTTFYFTWPAQLESH